MNKLTKIIATIGPSSENKEVIEKLIKEGVDVFRFNFKHNTVDWHEKILNKVISSSEKIKKNIATLIDLQGPEVRLKILKNLDKIELFKGKRLIVGEDIEFSHKEVLKKIKNDQKIFVDDGAFSFRSLWSGKKLILESEKNGFLKDRKTANFPGVNFDFPSLTVRDLDGVRLACREKMDFIALSFVRSKKDIQDLKKEIKKYEFYPKIIAKIETEKAIKNIDEILDEADGVMVARGDMGIEIPIEQVPYYQKMIIKKAKEKNKFVITATQMLKSMVSFLIPTRAEVSDVANACYDETDAVMLSEETAGGKYPVETVKKMKEIILFNENKFPKKIEINFERFMEKEEIIAKNLVDIINLSREKSKSIDAVIVFTETGKTARVISSFRPHLPIIAVVPNKNIALSLMVCYGIYPVVYSEDKGKEITLSSIEKVIDKIKKIGFSFKNTLVIHGDFWRVKGKISVMRFYNF
ncbi:MAG: pyruvate kinase [Patescibacteria group bacterium]|nr:pyruvate kinase [Patescibacteria group bacterium]